MRSRPALMLIAVAAMLLCGCNYVVLGDSIGTQGATTYATVFGDTIHAQPAVDAVAGEQLPAFEDGILRNQGWRKDIAGANVITLSIGSNDLGLLLIRYSLGGCNTACVDAALTGFKQQYSRTLDELRAMTKAHIIVLDIYDPSPALVDPYVRQQLAGVNAFIHQSVCAHGNMAVASVNLAFNGADGTADPASQGYLAPDGTHPSALGATVIADAVAAAHC